MRATSVGAPRPPARAHRPARASPQAAANNRRGPPAVAALPGTPASPAHAATKYDYIVVGGGLAGCVLASRLSADPSKQVLVLEAGPGDRPRQVATPAGLPRLFKSVYDWNIFAAPQPAADARRVYMARGRLLGGSSCTNATLYHRGAAADYDGWGVPGWAAADMLPWFVAGERNSRGAVPGVHGAGGPVSVEDPRYHNRLADAFLAAARAAGIPANPDFNDWARPQAGSGEFQVTQDRGARCDAAAAYLTPAVRARANLHIKTRARALKVEIEGGAARGVVYGDGDTPDASVVDAELAPGGEVVLTAGAVHTPHLLLLSGVGPAAALRAAGIPVVVDAPGVGANLQDHPAALAAWTLSPSAGPISVTDHLMHASGRLRLRALAAYALARRGPLATTGCDRGAFVSTRGGGAPDLQIRLAPGLALNPDGISSYVEFGKLAERGEKWPSGVTMQLLGVRPASRGSVTLATPDPWDAPRVDPGYLSDAGGADAATLREGVKLARAIAAASPLADLIDAELHPGPATGSDAAIDEYVRATLHSGNAVVGTAALGAAGDPAAVVTPDLKVKNVTGLRIADASVMPRVPGGQTGAPAFVIAERAAALMGAAETLDVEGVTAAREPALVAA